MVQYKIVYHVQLVVISIYDIWVHSLNTVITISAVFCTTQSQIGYPLTVQVFFNKLLKHNHLNTISITSVTSEAQLSTDCKYFIYHSITVRYVHRICLSFMFNKGIEFEHQPEKYQLLVLVSLNDCKRALNFESILKGTIKG